MVMDNQEAGVSNLLQVTAESEGFQWSYVVAVFKPATSAVTVSQKPVTYWNQEARMATQSTLRNPWKPLLHP